MARSLRRDAPRAFDIVRSAGAPWIVVCVLATLLYVLMLVSDPVLPSSGLDPSWTLANEHAARAGLIFGRDYVFTYGPLAFLSTKLYGSSTFALVILGDAYLAVLLVLPLFFARGLAPVLLYVAVLLVAPIVPDALFSAAMLGLFAVALRRGSRPAVLLGVLAVPFLFAKYSYAIVLLPLLALVDLKHLLAGRRVPVFLPAAILTAVAMQLLLRQPLSAFADLFRNVGDIVAGYGDAMQAPGRRRETVAVVAATASLIVMVAWFAHRRRPVSDREERLRDAAYGIGLAWFGFMVVKMGYVRHDGHVVNSWQALVLAVPVVVAYFAARARLSRGEGLAALALAGVAGALCLTLVGYYAGEPPGRAVPLASVIEDRMRGAIRRPARTLRWLSSARWAEADARRRAAETALARRFPAAVRGGVDIIPFDIAPLLASGLDYRPRPVPQSYSAYTPRLQRLDAAFFADPARAPATLLLKLGDIDRRLPTLATGPTLPVLLRWYAPVGGDPLGTVLRRRTTMRAQSVTRTERHDVAIGERIAVPAAAGEITIARLSLPKTPFGRLLGFVARQPLLDVRVTFVGGGSRTYRFIPAMAESGFLLSPLPTVADARGLSDAAPLFANDGASAGLARVADFVILGDGLARRSFGRGDVVLETVRLGR